MASPLLKAGCAFPHINRNATQIMNRYEEN
jgi:hypothetical protein